MSKRKQTDVAQVQDIENGTTETIDAFINDGDNRDAVTVGRDTARETRWKKRYWGAAFAVIILVTGATWYVSNYVTHWYGTRMYPDVGSTSSMMTELAQHKKLIEQLHAQVKSKTITKIWFDRKRQHSDMGFAIVDAKYPAGYEIWEDGKLVERWHWKIPGQPKTDQYSDYIFRCVSTYDLDGEYTGFKQSVISHYPNDLGIVTPIDNSLEYTLSIKDNSFSLKSYDLDGEGMEILWRSGKLVHTHLHTRDFMHSKQEGKLRDLYSIIQVKEQLIYIEHLAKMFPFLKTDILEPFKLSSRYEKFKSVVRNGKKVKAVE